MDCHVCDSHWINYYYYFSTRVAHKSVCIVKEINKCYIIFLFPLGSKGNLTEEEGPLGISLVITVGSILLSVYFLVWQTYVLKTDVIINAVLLIIYGIEGIFHIIAIAAFVS